MSIREYFDEIRHLIANTPFILSISLHLEERPPFAGLNRENQNKRIEK